VAEIHAKEFGAEEPQPPVVHNYLLALLEKLSPDTASEIVELVHGDLQR
jgi:hypothetical protein